MTNIIDAARKHFDGMKGQTITVEEWGGVTVHYDPPSLEARQMIQKRAGKSEARQCCYVLIMCLKTAEGERLFKDDADTIANFMSNVDPRVVARIAEQVLTTSDEATLGN